MASEGGPFLTGSSDGKMADVWDRFKKLQPTDPAVRVEHVTIMADGPSAEHVLEALEKAGCDLIVMGMHGRSCLRHRLFAGLTEEVVRLEYTLEIVPAHLRVVQWFNERIEGFVKTYAALVRQDAALQERLKDQFVEEPVTKIRLTKYLASSTLERDGRTHYFEDEEALREFEKNLAAKP